jgi:transposase
MLLRAFQLLACLSFLFCFQDAGKAARFCLFQDVMLQSELDIFKFQIRYNFILLFEEEVSMENKRIHYTADDKVQILRKHLVEKVPVSDICDQYGLNPTLFYRWQKEFFDNGSAAFEQKHQKNSKKFQEKISFLESKLAKKDEVIAEIMESHIQLKKNLGKFEWKVDTARYT